MYLRGQGLATEVVVRELASERNLGVNIYSVPLHLYLAIICARFDGHVWLDRSESSLAERFMVVFLSNQMGWGVCCKLVREAYKRHSNERRHSSKPKAMPRNVNGCYWP